ncbi:MAG TPA: glycosyltransferase family 39 protein [Gemmatimonadaceae bacterium]|nr:glycosyltransferase family 39 protein [Gemmatimonadaceae bacterium]
MSTSVPAPNVVAHPGRARPIVGVLAAVVLAAVAVLLDAQGSAEALTGSGSGLTSSVGAGMWIFKVWLIVHAAAVLAATLVPPTGSGARLLAAAPATSAGAPTVAWLLLAILAVGAALRFYALGDGLWHDEVRALVIYARAPFAEILTTFDSQNQHLLYSLLAHGALSVVGDEVVALRLPAALFGLASLWATYWLGSIVASRREGLLAAALLAASYHHVWFSQNARGYTGLLFFALLSTALLVRLMRSDRAEGWGLVVLYAVVSAFGVYTHTGAVFVTAGHFIVWGVLAIRARLQGRRLGWPGWLPIFGFALATTLTIQLYAPVLPQLLQTSLSPTLGGVAVDWKHPLWFLREMFGGMARGIPGGFVTVGAALAIGAAGVVSYVRRAPAVLALMLLPALLTAAAMIATDHNLWPRLFFFCAGFAALLAVRGVMALATVAVGSRGPAWAAALLVLGAAASLTTVPRAWGPKQDFEGALAYVESRRAPGDAVVALDMARFTFRRYLGRDWPAAETVASLAAIEAQHPRTWVVYTFPARLEATQPALLHYVRNNYSRAARFTGTVGGGAVIVMVRE